jgi:phospholipase/lecithinase/hemolysin
MPININRLIIFGDSMSDIGNKRSTGFGRVARAIGEMRTNDVGRFSDSKNWVDFLWEWTGGETFFQTNAQTTLALTKPHLKLNKNANQNTCLWNPFDYANYAIGGDMGASDRSKTGIGFFKGQQKNFLKNVKKYPCTGNTLFIVWFGLNDLVTNTRNPENMKPVAQEMINLCEEIEKKVRNSYFIFANIPNPQTAARYIGQENNADVLGFHHGAILFSQELARHIFIFPNNKATLLDIFTPMQDVSDNPSLYGIKPGRQPRGVKVRYGKFAGFSSNYNFATTSDGAHPTEAVYKLIGQIWAREILSRFDLGMLRSSKRGTFTGQTTLNFF